MLTASLKPLPDVEGAFRWIPSHLTLSPFVDMWQTIPLLTYLENSLIVCSVASVASVIVALLAAYAVSRYRFHGGRCSPSRSCPPRCSPASCSCSRCS